MSNPTLQASRPLISIVWLSAIGLGGVAAGWLMAAFALPWYGWLIAAGLTLYLAQVGQDGIAIANVVLIVAMSVATLRKAWPMGLEVIFPDYDAKQWATLLMVIWMGGITWLVLLGYGRSRLQRILRQLGLSARYAAPLMAGLTLLTVLIGRLLQSQ